MAIMNLLSRLILKALPDSIIREIRSSGPPAPNVYFSQEGEDILLERFMGAKKEGFYVDVGAHHPVRFSNTYKFYLKGWKGINIDAMPGSMQLFNDLRPRDINIECPVADEEADIVYYQFNEPALNTFSASEAQKKNNIGPYNIIAEQQLRARKLSAILDEFLPEGGHIDFMTVDVEGFDLKVLQSNDWEKYRPDLLLVEDLRGTVKTLFDTAIYRFMQAKGYDIVARTFNTVFFKNIQ